MKLLITLFLISAIVAAVTAAHNSNKDDPQTPRSITAAEYSQIFAAGGGGASGAVLDGEDPESPLLPWAVHLSLPWQRLNASSAFSVAARHFPKSVARFAELVIDTPDALAIADLFALKLPAVQVIHGQQGRFEQMMGMGGLPFGDTPFDQAANVAAGALAGTAAAAATPADVIKFVARSLPVTVFSKLDHEEMPSVIKINQLSEAAKFMFDAQQKKATLIAMEPLLLPSSAGAGGKKQQLQKQKDAIKFGREWIKVATLSAGAQFVGRNGGMVFLLDGTVVSDDADAAKEFALSKSLLDGSCERSSSNHNAGGEGSGGACFDIISLEMPEDAFANSATIQQQQPHGTATPPNPSVVENIVSASSDISKIPDAIRTACVVDNKNNDGQWKDFYGSIVSKHSSARTRYARVFEAQPVLEQGDFKGFSSSDSFPPAERDVVRPLVNTQQFQAELAQSRAGLFVIAFLRPSDRNYDRHLKAVNELALSLYRDRRGGPQRNRGAELRFEVFSVDTDIFPGVAEGFGAAQVPSMFVVHHLENNQHAIAQYRGEFSMDKLKGMEDFVREKAFDNQALSQFRAERVVFVPKRQQGQGHDDKMMIPQQQHHSFHVPFQKLSNVLSKFLVTVKTDSLVASSGGGAGSHSSSSSSSSSSNSNKKKETPEQEAKRLKAEAAKQRKAEEQKRKIEEELEKKRLAKEERIKAKQEAVEAAKKKKQAENDAKLQQIKKEVREGKRSKKITREDVRSKREAVLKNVKPKAFDVFRQDKLEAHLRKENGWVGQTYTEGDHESEKVSIKDELW